MNETELEESKTAEAEATEETEAIEETEAAEATPEQPEKKSSTEPKRRGGQVWVASIALLALLGTAGGLGIGYIYWQKFIQSSGQPDARSQQIQQRLTAQKGQLERLQQMVQQTADKPNPLYQQLEERLTAQQDQMRALSQMIRATQGRSSVVEESMALLQQRGRGGNSQTTRQEAVVNELIRLRVYGVESLLRSANLQLRSTGDVDIAVATLQAADEQLRNIKEPLWAPVHQQISQDLAALQGVKQPDLSAISQRLSALSHQVTTTQPRGSSAPAVKSADTSSKNKTTTFSWGSALQNGWQALRSLLIIQRHDRPVSAPKSVSTEQLYFLQQNLQIRLEAARMALLRRDQTLYSESLEQTTKWLQQSVDNNQVAVKPIIDEIDKLRQQQIAPQLPDISGSLRILQELNREIIEEPQA